MLTGWVMRVARTVTPPSAARTRSGGASAGAGGGLAAAGTCAAAAPATATISRLARVRTRRRNTPSVRAPGGIADFLADDFCRIRPRFRTELLDPAVEDLG